MKEQYDVYNKSAGIVIYNIPEMNIRREFAPHEVKHIGFKELEALSMVPGGRELIYDYLFINDEEIIHYLINRDIVPEYYLTEDQIPTWMDSCSLDEFKDALDFAPDGTKDLIKKYAIEKPLNDHSKRVAIKEQLGFDVDKAIENNSSSEEEEKTSNKVISSSTRRRSSATTIKKPVETKE